MSPRTRVPVALPVAVAFGLAWGVAACQMDPSPANSEAPSAHASDPAVQVTIGDIDWFVDYDAAVAVARAEKKALWVHFGEDPG